MMQCNRFYTDQNFKKRIIINSCSLRNLKWGQNNNDTERKSVIETSTNQKLFNNDVQRLSTSISTEKEKNNIILSKEEEQKRKEEVTRKREMSYRARKRIILRMKGIPDEKEQKKEKEKAKNKTKKIRKIEIKFPADNVKFKRVNSNNIINFNCSNFNNNDFEILDKFNTNIDNKNDTKSVIDNINNDMNINKMIKNNFVFYGGVRNVYKKNLIKDISVLTDKSCKILKVTNFHNEKKEICNEQKQNPHKYNENKNKKNSILYREKNDKSNNEESKNVNNNNILKNNHAMIKNLENQRNKKPYYENTNITNNNDINDIYYSLNSSKKMLTRINSDFLNNQKKNTFFVNNENELDELNNDNDKNIMSNNINNKRKIKRKRNDNSEQKNIYNFSFFNFKSKPNNINTETEEKKKKLDKSKTFKLEFSSHKSNKKEIINNNMNMINLRILPNNYLGNNKFNSIESDYFENNENKKTNYLDKRFYIIHFFEDLIDISNSMDNKNLLATLLNNFNQKYYFKNNVFNKEFLTIYKDNENFEYIFKHFSLVLICLIFLSKDETLYETYFIGVRELLIKLIYSSLNYVEIDGNKESNKIYNFINNNSFQSIIPNRRYILSLIYLLFENKKEYLPLKEALEQLHNILIKRDLKFIFKVINDSLLFCYNSKPKSIFNFPFFSFKNNILTIKNNQDKQDNDINYTNYINSNISNKKNNISNLSTNNIPHNNIRNISVNKISYDRDLKNENIPSPPYIKTPSKKNFSLVLDIDETISHSLKLSCGCYFLLRPGTQNFLKEVSKFYEIIIFTSSPKKYADKILNKIDIDGNLISHRLYRNHVLYENGKSVKNLNLIGRDLSKTIFIDNLRSNAKYNLNNLCPISTWRSDIFDNRLLKMKDKLIHIATCGKYEDDITQGL